MQKAVVGFLSGCILTALIFYFVIMPVVQRQSAEQLTKTVNLQGEVQSLQSQIQTITADRDAWKSKFDRATIPHDVGILGGEVRTWMIPVDVEPKAFANKRGTYSHYDPKTQTETVHFTAKNQQKSKTSYLLLCWPSL